MKDYYRLIQLIIPHQVHFSIVSSAELNYPMLSCIVGLELLLQLFYPSFVIYIKPNPELYFFDITLKLEQIHSILILFLIINIEFFVAKIQDLNIQLVFVEMFLFFLSLHLNIFLHKMVMNIVILDQWEMTKILYLI